jgi:hypothetical protein
LDPQGFLDFGNDVFNRAFAINNDGTRAKGAAEYSERGRGVFCKSSQSEQGENYNSLQYAKLR